MVFMTKHTQNCHNTKAIAVPKEKGKKWQKMRVKIANINITHCNLPVKYLQHHGMGTQCAAVCQNPKPYPYPRYPFWKHCGYSHTPFKPYMCRCAAMDETWLG